MLKLKPQTAYNWLDAGVIPHVRLGRRMRVRREDLEAFLQASLIVPKKPAAPADRAARAFWAFWAGELEPQPAEAVEPPASDAGA